MVDFNRYPTCWVLITGPSSIRKTWSRYWLAQQNRKEHNQGNQDKRRTEQEDKEPNNKEKTQNFKSIIFRGESGLCFIAILVAQKEAQIFEDTMGSSSSYYLVVLKGAWMPLAVALEISEEPRDQYLHQISLMHSKHKMARRNQKPASLVCTLTNMINRSSNH